MSRLLSWKKNWILAGDHFWHIFVTDWSQEYLGPQKNYVKAKYIQK